MRGLRIPVATVLRLLAGGYSDVEIVAEYPDLRVDDVRACLQYAADSREPRDRIRAVADDGYISESVY